MKAGCLQGEVALPMRALQLSLVLMRVVWHSSSMDFFCDECRPNSHFQFSSPGVRVALA